MALTKTCRVKIEKRGRQAYVVLPFDARAEFGRKTGPVYLAADLDGVQVRGKLATVEKTKPAFFLTAEVLKKLGWDGGERTLKATFAATDPALDTPVRPAVAEECGMDVLRAITSRASIRKYTGEPVDDEAITTVLNAGFCAPSADNKRPWEFVVVKDKATMAALADASQYAKMAKDAAFCVVVCGDLVRQGEEEFILEDGSAAVQNMLLAAHGLGLGAVWCGVWKGSGIRAACIEQLHLPDKIMPMALLVFGWPDEKRRRPARYVPGRVHHEKW